MSAPIIQASGLTKVYPGGHTALAAIDLAVREGEIFGFLGPNGAGKTSTIKILTTLSRPSSGAASVAGFDVVRDGPAVRRVIGYVAQEAGVDHFLTGRQNLVLQGRLYPLGRRLIEERTHELLGLFDLLPVADRLVSSYSGGTKRKLDIATALLHRPRVLFLDEPTLGLDLQSPRPPRGHSRSGGGEGGGDARGAQGRRRGRRHPPEFRIGRARPGRMAGAAPARSEE